MIRMQSRQSQGLLYQGKIPETGTGGPGTADSPGQGVVLASAHIDGIRTGVGGPEGRCRTVSIPRGFLSLLVVTCLTHLPPGRERLHPEDLQRGESKISQMQGDEDKRKALGIGRFNA